MGDADDAEEDDSDDADDLGGDDFSLDFEAFADDDGGADLEPPLLDFDAFANNKRNRVFLGDNHKEHDDERALIVTMDDT